MKPQTFAPTHESRSLPALAEVSRKVSISEALGTIPSSKLLQGLKYILINHNGTVYRLQETKLGKLILTK